MAPIHDVDGICPRKTKLTGVLHFARWNLASIRYHQTIKVTAPTTPEPAQRPHARVEYRKDPAGPTLYTQFRLFFDTSDQWAQITGTVNPNTGYLLFAISPVQTSAINFYKREYTRLRVVSYNNTSPIHLRGFLALQDNHKYFAVARALIGDGRCTDRFTIPCERT
jgi:hypothetical protein